LQGVGFHEPWQGKDGAGLRAKSPQGHSSTAKGGDPLGATGVQQPEEINGGGISAEKLEEDEPLDIPPISPPRQIRYKHNTVVTARSVYWFLRRGGWPEKRIGLHPNFLVPLYVRLAILQAPDQGLYTLPRVHNYQQVRLATLQAPDQGLYTLPRVHNYQQVRLATLQAPDQGLYTLPRVHNYQQVRLATLQAPDQGLYTLPRVHNYQQTLHEDEEQSEQFDPSNQCSIWRQHTDPNLQLPFYHNTLTDYATWRRDETDLPQNSAFFTVFKSAADFGAEPAEGSRDSAGGQAAPGQCGADGEGVADGDWDEDDTGSCKVHWASGGNHTGAKHRPVVPQFEVRYWCRTETGYVLGARSSWASLLEPITLKWEHPSVTASRGVGTLAARQTRLSPKDGTTELDMHVADSKQQLYTQ
ncbi:hypothetical protein CYMTET_30508, partial [Cymbomonas tetramitiformis]